MDLSGKYHISDEETKLFRLIKRKAAYWDLMDELAHGDYEGFDPTDEEIEIILDAYENERCSDYTYREEAEDMRFAIDSVRRHEYKVEVHYLAYDTVTVWDMSEEAAHEQARNRFETKGNGCIDGFIRVTSCGTVEDNGIAVDDEDGGHTTSWE